jgi:signal transduction histidine kinase
MGCVMSRRLRREDLKRAATVCLRGLVSALLAGVVGIPLFVFSVVSISLIPVGVGVLATPPALLGLRDFANLQRRWAAEWSGVTIESPYAPRPTDLTTGLIGAMQRVKWLLNDRATGRDLVWAFLNAPVGMFLCLMPLSLIGFGVNRVLVAPWIDLASGDSPLYLLTIPAGIVSAILGYRYGQTFLDLYARFCGALLAPDRADLQARVGQLTDTRAQVVDSSAAELRRIERDLHDGAQARLVGLGMNIGLAEQLLHDDPDAAMALLVEARQSSGAALRELRGLVRGIHPPVLAERGLDGAIRALVLTLPMPVDVHIDLPGRLSPPVEAAAYFAVAEMLANIAKHSGARSAWIRVRHDRGSLYAIIGDDGVGGAAVDAGTGLAGVETRLAAFDGTMFLTSPTGGPTVVTLEIPCELSSART